MSGLILNSPEITADIVTGGTPAGTPIDISCHVQRVEITTDQDETDASTFCNPGGTEPGPPTYGADIDWRLQRDATNPDQTATALASLVGQTVAIQMRAQGADTKGLGFVVDFGLVNPGVIGVWEAGEAVEASTSHAIGSTPPAWANWVAVP